MSPAPGGAGAARRWRMADADWNHWPDGLDDAALLDAAASCGLAGIELGVYACEEQLDQRRLARVQLLCAQRGLAVAAVLVSLPTARWPGGALSARQAGQRARLDRLVDGAARVAASLGHRVLGIWPGADPPGAPGTAAGLARVATLAKAHGVGLAVEYKPGTAVADAAEAAALAAEVPGTGVLLDTAHAHALGEDPAEVVQRLGPLLWHVHLGDAQVGEGDADLPLGRVHDAGGLLAALDALGYAGWASFDLYGAACSGATTGTEAVRESLAHLAAVDPGRPR